MTASQRLDTWLQTPTAGVVTFGLVCGLLALRVLQGIVTPPLAYEDGRDMLAFYFNHPEASSVLRSYAGYISLVPNLTAWTGVRFGLPAVPHLFSLASVALAAGGLTLLAREGHAWLVERPRDRLLLVLLLCALPLGDGYLLTNLAYSQWSLLLILFVLLTRRMPTTAGGSALHAGVAVLCAWSNPLSIFGLPVAIVRSVMSSQGHQRRSLVGVSLGIVLYQLVAVEARPDVDVSFDDLTWALKVFLARVPFEAVFGAHATASLLAAGGQFYVYAVAAAVMASLALATIEGPRPVVSSLLTGLVLLGAFGMVLASTLVRFTGPGERGIYFEAGLQRYIYLPKVSMAVCVLSACVPPVTRWFVTRSPLPRVLAASICLMFLLGINVANNSLYSLPAHRDEGKRMADFLQRVQDDLERASRGQPYQVRHVLTREGEWDVVMDIDSRLGRH